MSQYDHMDACILKAIRAGENPTYAKATYEEKVRLAKLTGREEMRIIDGRLSALKRAGKIEFLTKSKAAEKGLGPGWRVI